MNPSEKSVALALAWLDRNDDGITLYCEPGFRDAVVESVAIQFEAVRAEALEEAAHEAVLMALSSKLTADERTLLTTAGDRIRALKTKAGA